MHAYPSWVHEFVKSDPAGPTAFAYEVAGLSWLRAAGPDGARVVSVHEATDREIRMEQLRSVAATTEAAADFGRRLAVTHDAGADAFGAPPAGWEGDGWIGVEPMPLATEPSWGAFFARHRCRPYLDKAQARGSMTTADATLIERLLDRLEAGDFDDDAPPARIHGDLWSGNLIPTADGYTLIDAAAHGGHRLTDLAMLCLFGAPRLEAVLDAYAAASTHLPDDWRSLVPLHQLHPLLVHAAIFGGLYGSQAASAARRYV